MAHLHKALSWKVIKGPMDRFTRSLEELGDIGSRTEQLPWIPSAHHQFDVRQYWKDKARPNYDHNGKDDELFTFTVTPCLLAQ